MARLNERGREVLDDTPVALPAKFKRQSWIDNMREFVRQELSRQAEGIEMESFEEADDFDVDDDPEIKSPYEISADQEFYLPPEPEQPAPAPQDESSAGGEVSSPPAEG